MKYLILGAGGTGGALGAYLARGGLDVTLLARGAHLDALRRDGLRLRRDREEWLISPIRAAEEARYAETPDVVFVCVKGYSIPDVVPLLRRIVTARTVVIPILNLYGTGARLQEALPGTLVTDGCIYVAAERLSPGCIRMRGDLLRVVFGVRSPAESRPELAEISEALNGCGVRCILSGDIRRDAMMKFAYVSPQGACGAYYDVPAGAMQRAGEYRDCFRGLIEEVAALAGAMGIRFEADPVERGLSILDALDPEMTTSLQRDLKAGQRSEVDGLIYEVARMGERLGVPTPLYAKIAGALRERGYR